MRERGWVVVDDSQDSIGPWYIELPGVAMTPEAAKAAFYTKREDAVRVAKGYGPPWRVVPVTREVGK